MTKKILILGGTSEALRLASSLDGARFEPVYSLAGVTRAPKMPDCRVRSGGFGGIGGLIDYLNAEQIDAVVDATHPFAAQMAKHAERAAATVNIPRLKLLRPPWQKVSGDIWTEVASTAEAARALAGHGWRVFLASGISDIAEFAAAKQSKFFIRLIEPPETPIPLPDHELILQRGPFDVAEERALFERLKIDRIVCKNSGGQGAQAKLIAARDCGIPVLMIPRPKPPAGEIAATVEAAMLWANALT